MTTLRGLLVILERELSCELPTLNICDRQSKLIGTFRFPDLPIWVTEYAYAHQSLPATQDFYKTSAEWMDGYEHVERYSYFGTFRSQNSNVGPNAAFLNRDGELTDIGSWYLGGEATGIDPQSGSDAGRLAVSYVIIGLVGTLATCILFA